jgi:hypothetical protein
MNRTLYLKFVTRKEIEANWDMEAIVFFNDAFKVLHDHSTLYAVRCNKKGVINWNTTGIYSFSELQNRKIQFVQ